MSVQWKIQKLMRKNILDAEQLDNIATQSVSWIGKDVSSAWPLGMMLYALALVVCALFMVTPLLRMAAADTMPAPTLQISLGSFVGVASRWFPVHLPGIHQNSSSNSLEFFGLITLMFLAYGLALLWVGGQAEGSKQFPVRACAWLGVSLTGVVYLVTPALLSHDTVVYASYGQLMAVYHANPYFVPFSSFPHDPLLPYDQWSQSVSAYGPVWILICGVVGRLVGSNPTSYVLAFRLVASSMNLLNIWLIGRTLQTWGRSPRAVTLGMVFYAWNPLVLLESGLDGHNDIFMLTFVLFGLLLAVRAEKRGQLLHIRGYLPSVIALMMAALVKFTALPILAAFLLLLVCRTLRNAAGNTPTWSEALHHWKRIIPLLSWSALVLFVVSIILYGPFWIGHSLSAIGTSLTDLPSSRGDSHSFFTLVHRWLIAHPSQNSLLVLLDQRPFWNDLNYAGVMLCLALGAIYLWHRPFARTFITLSLAALGLLLLLTPWFYAWYVIWIVGLAAVGIPFRESRSTWSWALCAFVLVFSYTALSIYISGFLGSLGYLWSLCNTLPPVCIFLLWRKYGFTFAVFSVPVK